MGSSLRFIYVFIAACQFHCYQLFVSYCRLAEDVRERQNLESLDYVKLFAHYLASSADLNAGEGVATSAHSVLPLTQSRICYHRR